MNYILVHMLLQLALCFSRVFVAERFEDVEKKPAFSRETCGSLEFFNFMCGCGEIAKCSGKALKSACSGDDF